LMDAFHEAGLPPGVINVVTGFGEVVGTELTKSPDIQKIAFTGSTQIGKLVAKNSLDTMKRFTLEAPLNRAPVSAPALQTPASSEASRQTSFWTTPISPRRSRWPSTPAI
jgi:Aldehyde dehydrogenase family